jgi:hypothetical protein
MRRKDLGTLFVSSWISRPMYNSFVGKLSYKLALSLAKF